MKKQAIPQFSVFLSDETPTGVICNILNMSKDDILFLTLPADKLPFTTEHASHNLHAYVCHHTGQYTLSSSHLERRKTPLLHVQCAQEKWRVCCFVDYATMHRQIVGA